MRYNKNKNIEISFTVKESLYFKLKHFAKWERKIRRLC